MLYHLLEIARVAKENDARQMAAIKKLSDLVRATHAPATSTLAATKQGMAPNMIAGLPADRGDER